MFPSADWESRADKMGHELVICLPQDYNTLCIYCFFHPTNPYAHTHTHTDCKYSSIILSLAVRCSLVKHMHCLYCLLISNPKIYNNLNRCSDVFSFFSINNVLLQQAWFYVQDLENELLFELWVWRRICPICLGFVSILFLDVIQSLLVKMTLLPDLSIIALEIDTYSRPTDKT